MNEKKEREKKDAIKSNGNRCIDSEAWFLISFNSSGPFLKLFFIMMSKIIIQFLNTSIIQLLGCMLFMLTYLLSRTALLSLYFKCSGKFHSDGVTIMNEMQWNPFLSLQFLSIMAKHMLIEY